MIQKYLENFEWTIIIFPDFLYQTRKTQIFNFFMEEKLLCNCEMNIGQWTYDNNYAANIFVQIYIFIGRIKNNIQRDV